MRFWVRIWTSTSFFSNLSYKNAPLTPLGFGVRYQGVQWLAHRWRAEREGQTPGLEPDENHARSGVVWTWPSRQGKQDLLVGFLWLPEAKMKVEWWETRKLASGWLKVLAPWDLRLFPWEGFRSALRTTEWVENWNPISHMVMLDTSYYVP